MEDRNVLRPSVFEGLVFIINPHILDEMVEPMFLIRLGWKESDAAAPMLHQRGDVHVLKQSLR